jgi:hypothetical protein
MSPFLFVGVAVLSYPFPRFFCEASENGASIGALEIEKPAQTGSSQWISEIT